MRRRRYLFWLFLAVIGALLAATQYARHSDLTIPALLPISREVARLPSRQNDYAWQSNTTFLRFETYPHLVTKRVDIRTGTESDLTRLLLQRAGDYIMYAHGTISPDGNKLLWAETGDRGPVVRSASLDTAASIPTNSLKLNFWASASNPIWLPDSRSWVQLYAASRELVAVVGEEGHAHTSREIKIGNPRGTYSGYDLMPAHLLGVTQAGHVLATPRSADGYSNSGSSRHIDFFEFRVDGPQPNVHEYTIDVPKAETGYEHGVALAHDEEIEISPQGDRLAWLLHRRIEFPAQGWLSRWLPGRTPSPHLYTELRITNLDGSGEKIVGRIEVKTNTKTPAEERPFEMHWLPDGQHISFIYNGSLWVVTIQP